jgi:hypothetical protein
VDLKKELIRQGRQYATEALTYRKKIAELVLGFIKDRSVVRTVHRVVRYSVHDVCFTSSDPHTFLLQSGYASLAVSS